MREAFRRHLASNARWDRLFDLGAQVVSARGLKSEREIDKAVDAAMTEVRRRRKTAR
jgi:hypothetical protein